MARTTGTRQLSLEELGTPLFEATFVVLDLETTGLSPETDRITEIGAVKVRGGEVLGELRTFVHPGRPIPPRVTAVTGITDAMVRDAPTVPSVLPTVLRFLDGAVFVAHNAAFDLGFLRAACERHGHPTLTPVVLDTARLARRLLKGEVRDCRLATLARHFSSPTHAEHRALADARATVDVLHGLIERSGMLGATTVEDLRDLASSRSDAAFRRRDMVRDAPATAGVYRFLDERGEVLYVGKATDLRSRLRTYFGQDPRRRIADLVRETVSVEWTTTDTVLEAEVRELREIRSRQPRYNRRSKRPGGTVHLALTREPFPRLSIVRRPGGAHVRTLGPLPNRRTAEALVEAIQEVTGLRTCSQRLRLSQDHPACVLKELARCAAPCDGTAGTEGYAQVVAETEEMLDDPSLLLGPLRVRMTALAATGRFERAADARRALHDAARGMARAREHAALVAAGTLVAIRPGHRALEAALIEQGRLIATWRLPPDATDARVLEVTMRAKLPDPEALPREDLEESALVLRWLDGHGTRLVHVAGELALPWAGGAALWAAREEARAVDRALRRDRQELDGTKVRRRTAASPGPCPDAPAGGDGTDVRHAAAGQVSSNQPLVTSTIRSRRPGSRPSQTTQMR